MIIVALQKKLPHFVSKYSKNSFRKFNIDVASAQETYSEEEEALNMISKPLEI